MRMTSEEFHAWSQRLQFTSETEVLIAAIRSSPPVRRVSGRAKNVTGRYPSPKMGMSIQFESEHVEFWAIYAEALPSPNTPEVRQILERASPRAQQEANRRLTQMLAYARGEPIAAPRRSAQRWWRAYQKAEAQHGCGYLGLLDRVAARGNRTPRIPDASMQLLEAHLRTHYAAPQAKSAAAVYRLYREHCQQQGLPPVSERTFYRMRARFTTTDVIAARRGRRAAYASAPFAWLDQTTPRHGERPFALVHLEHTELDIELISSVLGNRWADPGPHF